MASTFVDGVDFIIDPITLEELLRGPEGEVAKHLSKLGISAVQIAAQLCPVDTGLLQSTIAWYLGRDEVGELAAYVGSPLYYAIYPEMGTRFQAPQPYLRPAADQAVTGDNSGWLGSLGGSVEESPSATAIIEEGD